MESPDIIPTREEFEKSGGNPEQFEAHVARKQDDLAAQVMAAAEKKAGDSVKIRVTGGPGCWRPGQTHIMVPCKAPTKDGKQNLPAEPGLRVRIGAVSEIPLRDAAHRECLAGDPNIEIMPNDALTYEEEQAAMKIALAGIRAQKAAKK